MSAYGNPSIGVYVKQQGKRMTRKDYQDTSSNDLTSRLQSWGISTGIDRYRKTRTQIVKRKTKDANGNIVTKEVEVDVADVERLTVEANIIDNALDAVVTKLVQLIEEYDPGRSCAPIKGLAEITSLDPTAVAATALNAMWECAGGTSDTAQRLDKIGNRLNTVMLRDEMSRHMGAKADALAKRAQKKFTSKWRQKRWLEKQAEFRGVTFKPMDKDVRIFVGTLAHNAVMQSTKLFQEQTQITKGRGRSEDNPHGLRTKTVLVLTDEAKAEVESGNARAKWMMPLFSPLGQPPVPWGYWHGSPYPDPLLSRSVHMVRGAAKPQAAAIDHALEHNEMPDVVEAVNHLQNVAWEINLPVWRVVKWCLDNKLEPCDSFPPQKELPFVAANDNGDDLDHFARIQYAEHMKSKLAVRSHLVTTSYLTNVVETIGDYPFWLPHNLDFRSRLYPVPVFNYQSADHMKSLHYFVMRKPIGADGLAWLYVHLAGCADFDDEQGRRLSKVPLADRIAWVDANRDMLIDIANNWRDHYDYWSEADKPFSFLAACFELRAVWQHYDETGNLNYLSGLPVSIDASCSGYQHLLAAMRASKEGAMVNLVPNDLPQDIYQFIADKVKAVVEADAAMEVDDDCPCDDSGPICECEKPALAKLWLKHGINRKVVKRQVMTAAYNSNVYGFTDQIKADTMDKLHKRVLDPEDDGLHEHPFAYGDDLRGITAAKYLAVIVYDQIGEHLSAANEAMTFFKHCLSAWSKRGNTLR